MPLLPALSAAGCVGQDDESPPAATQSEAKAEPAHSKPAMPPGHPAPAAPSHAEPAMPPGHPAPAGPDTSGGTSLEKSASELTVEGVSLRKKELAGTEITLRGRVVKYNAGILGKNWLHIQDGTGADSTDDLTVTTDATAAVGDTVAIRGVVVCDKDFGSGYLYDVIVEDADVTIE